LEDVNPTMKVPGEIEEPVSRETLLVLHAEDSDDCAVLVQRALKRAGFSRKMLRFRDGLDAIKHLDGAGEAERPHVLLLDLNMPVKGGLEVLEWVRRHPVYRGVPAIVLTASLEPAEHERAAALGALKSLPKDGTFREVTRILEQLIAAPGKLPPAA
jgi:CheY-like chemotaxis protein